MEKKRSMTAAPAVAMTAVSMVLTVVVIVMWLGEAMPWAVALVVGLGLDGGWLATLAYERRLAARGDHSRAITGVGWGFGAVATGVLVAHALGEESAGAWLAVAWLPLAAKALWLVHGLWERTALTPTALDQIRDIQQDARDRAAVARAQLRAEAGTEVTRLEAVTGAGARVARVQAETAGELASAWSTLEEAREGEGTARALTCVTSRVTPTSPPSWRLPVWGPTEPVPAAIEGSADVVPLSNEEIDGIMSGLVDSGSYRVAAGRFRDMGYSAGEARLQASWRRVTREVAA
uniref:Protein SpdB n=1 Tax=Streptomyces lividans TaxID=1916 RepID=SPDB_STRLI|nr:plasmid transfer protein SpdB [Streptomyces lividans]P22408.1 RecName: Full=Protein SpdB [Streptomyces lividans]AAA88408.1 unknown [Streptomyces lividans]